MTQASHLRRPRLKRPKRPRSPYRNATSFFDVAEAFQGEDGAEAYFIQQRWPNGVHCPHCGTDDIARGNQTRRRRQLWYCHNPECEKMFSVTSGTVMEATKLPLRKWMMAYHFIGASKQGISSLQLARMLHVSYETAWHLAHRIRGTMAVNSQHFSGIVETDETYVGGKRKGRGRGYRGNKVAVQTIIQRADGAGLPSLAQTISLDRPEVDGRTVGAKLRTHTEPTETLLMTDESQIYERVGRGFMDHRTVNHKQEEYVRLDADGVVVTTNTAEGFFANLKRQLIGTHHSTSKKHLPRYLEEFDFKYNTRDASDVVRTEAAIGNIEGVRIRLHKAADGKGESLYDRRADEPGKPHEPAEEGAK